MSSDLMLDEDEGGIAILDLPDRASGGSQFTSRKTVYTAGELNPFTYLVNEEQHQGALDLRNGKIRLNRITARIQESKDAKRLIVTAGLILDGEEIGTLDSDGNFVAHELYTNERYRSWNNREKRPHRINANQWVQPENVDLLKDFVNYLRANHGWQIIPRPAQSRNRTTRDLFVARPASAQGQAEDGPQRTGVFLDAFEISVNLDYADGFKSFKEGLDEQLSRWEAAAKMQNDQHRAAAMKRLAENIHFLGGYYHSDSDNRDWARAVDTGAFWLDGKHFPLYKAKGDEDLTDDLFADLFSAPSQGGAASAPDSGELELPDSF